MTLRRCGSTLAATPPCPPPRSLSGSSGSITGSVSAPALVPELSWAGGGAVSSVVEEGGGPWSSAGGCGGCGGSSSGLCTFKGSSHNVHCNGVLASFPVLHLSSLWTRNEASGKYYALLQQTTYVSGTISTTLLILVCGEGRCNEIISSPSSTSGATSGNVGSWSCSWPVCSAIHWFSSLCIRLAHCSP